VGRDNASTGGDRGREAISRSPLDESEENSDAEDQVNEFNTQYFDEMD
jgi:hypothetical protein